ncbi:MAG: aminotransferase class I/II-fold pyridoxal phosphate-dependent enzyme [Desulfobacteraceae bacterium]|nr:MAG: aminotransferase class I/II-fold pyridoxal phosphate-dependent enzyme [Desulfobacteraceae bacterium]
MHAGETVPRVRGAVCMPVFQTAMFEYTGEKSYDDLRYIRLNNTPNHEVLHARIADLENGEAALVTASGMAAITTALLTVLSAGDHILAQSCLYGGTHDFVTRDLEKYGISYDFIDGSRPETWNDLLRPKTRAIYVETMTNPLLEVADLEAVADFAREKEIISIIDNTFATPVNFRPLEAGFDLCIHSCTKYLNGHSDIVAGAVIGTKQLIGKITRTLNHLGGSLDPHACFLLERGMKTLAVRMRQHNESALRIAGFLEKHPLAERVNYPGLPSHPGYSRAVKLFKGFGGMLSFELKGDVEAAERFIKALKIPIIAPSLGGVESLVTRPATTSHAGMSPVERKKLGISDRLIRLSVGIEATDDLLEDLELAMHSLS